MTNHSYTTFGYSSSESEGANFWLSVITDLNNRGIKDVLTACVDGLKPVYKAATREAAEMALDELEEKWGKKYPVVIKSWRSKWQNLAVFFKYPEDIRRVIYTTNAIEAVHRQFRKLTKTKGAFPR